MTWGEFKAYCDSHGADDEDIVWLLEVCYPGGIEITHTEEGELRIMDGEWKND